MQLSSSTDNATSQEDQQQYEPLTGDITIPKEVFRDLLWALYQVEGEQFASGDFAEYTATRSASQDVLMLLLERV